MPANWKNAGLTYARYACAAAAVLRSVFKEPLRRNAQVRGRRMLILEKWTQGRATSKYSYRFCAALHRN
jgi:hypothetical protein